MLPSWFKHVRVAPALRALGAAIALVGASRLSEVPELFAFVRAECDSAALIPVFDGPSLPCWVPQATWHATFALSLLALGATVMTARRVLVGGGLLAISALWYFHLRAPYFPIYPLVFTKGYLHAALLFCFTVPPILTPAVLLLLGEPVWRGIRGLAHLLPARLLAILARLVSASAGSPKSVSRMTAVILLAFGAIRMAREIPLMAATYEGQDWSTTRTDLFQMKDAVGDALMGVSLLVMGVALLSARRVFVGGTLAAVSGLWVIHFLVPGFPVHSLDLSNIPDNLLKRPLYNGVHIAISLLVLMAGVGVTFCNTNWWLTDSDSDSDSNGTLAERG